MSRHFPAFARIVASSFAAMTATPSVFVADIDGDDLWIRYLRSFPEGTDPIYKTNTWHTCSCCRHFIKHAGTLIGVAADGSLTTVWDRAVTMLTHSHYADTAAVLQSAVRDAGIRDLFRVGQNEGAFGAKITRSQNPVTLAAMEWEHFYTGTIPANLRVALPDAVRGEYRTTVQVFERGLTELSPDAVETVLGLIASNALYRGEEHQRSLSEFQKMQRQYAAASDKSVFAWTHAASPAARFRNTVIGTLVQDLSEGKDLEYAVRGFETKVAPLNYKRTTALITPSMVKNAMTTIEQLGLEPALDRRFATLADVSVNDVKWVDGTARPLMKGGLAATLMKHAAPSRPTANAAIDISLDDFMTTVLPTTTELEIFFTAAHLGNLMAITAPVHPEPKQLFKWTNDFAWSYGGNVADSIKERVKKAGGKVDNAVLRISLSWYNYDDLDLHIHEPRGGHISFSNKRGISGGILDVDMNAGSGTTREPVENVTWSGMPPDGAYRIVVHNYSQRETSNPGFVVETESEGKLAHYSFRHALRGQQSAMVATLHLKSGKIASVTASDPGITSAAIPQEKWGLTTEQYVKVKTVMLSPNYWGDNAVGNKHTFFVLEGACSDEDTRGFYNEFLHPRLTEHRKVFEVIGDKMKCKPIPTMIAGLGFSSTAHTSFLVRANRRIYTIGV